MKLDLVVIYFCFIFRAAVSNPESEQVSQQHASNATGSKTEESSISRLANSLFSYDESEEENNKNDLVPSSDGDFRGPQYLLPPSYPQYDCNICNEIPWIPVASDRVHRVVNIEPPKNYASLIANNNNVKTFNPEYFSKDSLSVSNPSFQIDNSIYNVPYPSTSYNPQSVQYQFQNKKEVDLVDYMLPPPLNYKIPSGSYGISQETYKSSQPKQTIQPSYNFPKYFSQPKPIYEQSHKATYGPPPKQNYQPAPKPDHGPPPKPEYIPPIYDLPKSEYGPPKLEYGPPKPEYGPPKPQYGPPKPEYGPPKSEYGSPKPEYRPPKPEYGPPQPEYGPPKPEYVAPIPKYGPPKPDYRPPQVDYSSPKQLYGAPNLNYGSPPKPFYDIPPANQMYSLEMIGNQYGVPSSIDVPLSTNQYGLPRPENYLNQAFFNNIAPTQSQTFTNDVIQKDISANLPSDSYGDPVTGDNLDLADALSLPSGDSDFFEKQIPLPNLSSLPVLPIHNYREFNQEFQSKSSQYDSDNFRNNNDVEIQPSVKLIEYLASIEHPISVIQSPLIELSVKDGQASQTNSLNTVTKDILKINEGQPYESGRSAYSSHFQNNEHLLKHLQQLNGSEQVSGNELVNERYSTSTKLSENPIVVEDTHTAASDISNSTVTTGLQFKRNNDKHLSVKSFGIVNNTGEFGNSHFSPPRLDYSSWTPSYSNKVSTSIVPQPLQETKQLQIIIPYVNNKRNQLFDKSEKQNKRESYTTLLPVYSPPVPTERSMWAKFMDDLKLLESTRYNASAFVQPTTAVYNIKEVFTKPNKNKINVERRPYDVVSLQKNIDNWTYQVYSSQRNNDDFKTETVKNIPNEYFSTISYTKPYKISTVKPEIFDQKSLETIHKDNILNNIDEDIKSNLILSTDTTTEKIVTTTPSSSTRTLNPNLPILNKEKDVWPTAVSKSPHSKEKIYVVTPQSYSFVTSTPATAWSMAPKIEHGKINNNTFNSHKFSVRIEAETKKNSSTESVGIDKKNIFKVVYSEWPYLSKFD